MQTMRALTVGADENLALFCAHLRQQHIAHRVFEERGAQVLEVRDATQAERVRADYAAWRDGRLKLRWLPGAAPRRPAASFDAVRRYPAVSFLVAAAAAVFPATLGLDGGTVGPLLPWLTIVPVGTPGAESGAETLYAVLAAGQWWRLVTPIFIHFSAMHLLFNLAVVIAFGRRIEDRAGSWFLCCLTLLIALPSNTAQFLLGHSALFGGLSGVAYGLFAYVAVRGRFDPAPEFRLNPAFIVVLLMTLVVMSSGITELFGLYLANAAHWVGLGIGAVAGLIWRPVRNPVDAV